MIGCYKINLGPNKYIVFNCNTTPVHKGAGMIHKNIFTNATITKSIKGNLTLIGFENTLFKN